MTERGLELSVNAPSGEAATERVEAAVHEIRPPTGVYLAGGSRPQGTP